MIGNVRRVNEIFTGPDIKFMIAELYKHIKTMYINEEDMTNVRIYNNGQVKKVIHVPRGLGEFAIIITDKLKERNRIKRTFSNALNNFAFETKVMLNMEAVTFLVGIVTAEFLNMIYVGEMLAQTRRNHLRNTGVGIVQHDWFSIHNSYKFVGDMNIRSDVNNYVKTFDVYARQTWTNGQLEDAIDTMRTIVPHFAFSLVLANVKHNQYDGDREDMMIVRKLLDRDILNVYGLKIMDIMEIVTDYYDQYDIPQTDASIAEHKRIIDLNAEIGNLLEPGFHDRLPLTSSSIGAIIKKGNIKKKEMKKITRKIHSLYKLIHVSMFKKTPKTVKYEDQTINVMAFEFMSNVLDAYTNQIKGRMHRLLQVSLSKLGAPKTFQILMRTLKTIQMDFLVFILPSRSNYVYLGPLLESVYKDISDRLSLLFIGVKRRAVMAHDEDDDADADINIFNDDLSGRFAAAMKIMDDIIENLAYGFKDYTFVNYKLSYVASIKTVQYLEGLIQAELIRLDVTHVGKGKPKILILSNQELALIQQMDRDNRDISVKPYEVSYVDDIMKLSRNEAKKVFLDYWMHIYDFDDAKENWQYIPRVLDVTHSPIPFIRFLTPSQMKREFFELMALMRLESGILKRIENKLDEDWYLHPSKEAFLFLRTQYKVHMQEVDLIFLNLKYAASKLNGPLGIMDFMSRDDVFDDLRRNYKRLMDGFEKLLISVEIQETKMEYDTKGLGDEKITVLERLNRIIDMVNYYSKDVSSYADRITRIQNALRLRLDIDRSSLVVYKEFATKMDKRDKRIDYAAKYDMTMFDDDDDVDDNAYAEDIDIIPITDDMIIPHPDEIEIGDIADVREEDTTVISETDSDTTVISATDSDATIETDSDEEERRIDEIDIADVREEDTTVISATDSDVTIETESDEEERRIDQTDTESSDIDLFAPSSDTESSDIDLFANE